MSKRPELSDISNILNSESEINQNNENIKDAFDNTLSRDGSTPNQMEADIDMNSNDILNINNASMNTLTIAGATLVPNDAVSIPDWKSAWATSTSYVVNDLVRQDGNTYICITAHTSGTFNNDLTMNKWELFASKGAAGAGTGDLLAANNLDDVADAATSRTNLGLGQLAVRNELLITDIPSGTKSGSDTVLITGTTGTDGNLSEWNADGDLVDGPGYGTSANDLVQLDSNALVPTALLKQNMSPVDMTSLSNHAFSVPSWCTRMHLFFKKISVNSGSNNFIVQFGTGSGYITSGYDSLSQGNSDTVTDSSGFAMRNSSASTKFNGVMEIYQIPGTQQWVSTHILNGQRGTGYVDVGAVTTNIRLNINGSKTFDDGTFSAVFYP